MTEPLDLYVDGMPCDETLLPELGRVNWAAARLHAAVRDAINRLDGYSSDEPFNTTLGDAIVRLRREAAALRPMQGELIVHWVDTYGQPANKARNRVIHAITYHEDADGIDALKSSDPETPGRLLVPELRAVTAQLIHAHMTMPT